jgi:uncharacterized SAM-binding protein YcdF (DUF218 family)
MFLFLSKLIPLLFYPIGLTILFTIAGIVNHRRKRHKFANRLLIVAILNLYLWSTPLIGEPLIRSLEFQYLPKDYPKVDAIVILGGATKSALPPRVIPEVSEAGDRVIYGAKLYRDGKAPKVILSGGRIPWLGADITAESSDMATLIEMLGVPRSAILEDPASLNTRQNAERVKEIIDREKIKTMLLITSATHMPRSVLIFKKMGMDVIPAPTDFISTLSGAPEKLGQSKLLQLLPDAEQLFMNTRAIKEYVGIIVYRLRGWT